MNPSDEDEPSTTPSGEVNPSVNPSDEVEPSKTPSGDNDGNGNQIVSALLDQIFEANTITFDYYTALNSKEDYKDIYYYDDNNNPIYRYYKNTDSNTIDVQIIVAKTEDSYNINIKGIQTSTYTINQYDLDNNLLKTYTDNNNEIIDIYYVDNEFYVYDNYREGYLKQNPTYINKAFEILTDTLNQLENLETNNITEILGQFIDYFFNIKDNKLVISYDYIEALNSITEYINAIDINNTNFKLLINDLLSLLDKELTIDTILDDIEIVADMTVEQLYNEINNWLSTNYETSIEGIHADICENQFIMKYIEEIIYSMNQESAESFMEEFNNFVLLDYIKECFNVKIVDFISPMFDENPEDDVVPTIEQIRQYIDQILEAPLNDDMKNSFEEIKNGINNIDLKKCDNSTEFKFNNVFKLDSISGSVDMEYTFIDEENYISNSYSQLEEHNMTVSNEVSTIKLPDNANIIELKFETDTDYFECQNDKISFSINESQGNIKLYDDVTVNIPKYYISENQFITLRYIYFNINKIDDSNYECCINDFELALYEQISDSQYRVFNYEGSIDNLSNLTFTITVDYDTMTYYVDGIPSYEFSKPELPSIN